MYVEEIQKYKNEEVKKNIKIYEKLRRGIPQEQSSSYNQATTQAKNYYYSNQKKPLLILMKSSYPTYHNNKIEQNRIKQHFLLIIHYHGRI